MVLQMLRKVFGGKRPSDRRAASRFRPAVVELEPRLLLAPQVWQGDVSNDWTTAQNWENDTIPGPNDTALLGVVGANNEPHIPVGANIRIAGVGLDATFAGKTLTIDGSLIIDHPTEFSSWDRNSHITGNGSLYVGARFFWTEGTISPVSFTIYNNGRFDVFGNASWLGVAHWSVGINNADPLPPGAPPGATRTGTMRVGSAAGMAHNLHFGQPDDFGYTISDNGTLELIQGRNSASAGGLVSEFGHVLLNRGRIRRPNLDANNETLNLNVAISQDTANADFNLINRGAVRIQPPTSDFVSFSMGAGTLGLGHNSFFAVPNGLIAFGGAVIAQSWAGGNAAVTIDGSVFLGGDCRLTVGHIANRYVSLNIFGDFTVGGGAVLRFNVNGAQQDVGDRVGVAGGFWLIDPNTARLEVTASVPPPAGRFYDVIVASFTVGAAAFGGGYGSEGFTNGYDAERLEQSFRVTARAGE